MAPTGYNAWAPGRVSAPRAPNVLPGVLSEAHLEVLRHRLGPSAAGPAPGGHGSSSPGRACPGALTAALHPQAAPPAGQPAGASGAGALPRPPAVLAKSAYVLDVASGAPVFQKFPTLRRPMASTAKLMTGLLAAESGRLEELATVSKAAAAVGETSMGLTEGERVAVLDLLYGLMLNSGNDAAITLAEHLAGSVDGVRGPDERPRRRPWAWPTPASPPRTGSTTPSSAPWSQYSSARDLALLGAAAMANPTLARVAGTTMREVAGPPGKAPHRLRHTVSAIWWYPGAVGGKTGWTARAGHVRVRGLRAPRRRPGAPGAPGGAWWRW